MKTVTKDDFDFSKGAEYSKIAPLDKNHVRVATTQEKIVSHHSSGVETENVAKIGDYIIKTKEDGDGYIIQAHRFFEIYENDPNDDRFYRNKEIRTALLTLEDVKFSTPWGEEQNVEAGGMIIEAGPYIYGVDRFSFIDKRGRVDNSPERNVFALLTEPLEMQLEKALRLDLANHVADIQLRIAHPHLFTR